MTPMETLDRQLADGTVWNTHFGTGKDEVVVWDEIGTFLLKIKRFEIENLGHSYGTPRSSGSQWDSVGH